MPFTTKKKKGRPKGTTTTESNVYSNMDNDEKRTYPTQKVNDHRASTSQPRTPAVLANTDTSLPSTSCGGRKKTKEGPMTPRTKKPRHNEHAGRKKVYQTFGANKHLHTVKRDS